MRNNLTDQIWSATKQQKLYQTTGFRISKYIFFSHIIFSLCTILSIFLSRFLLFFKWNWKFLVLSNIYFIFVSTAKIFKLCSIFLLSTSVLKSNFTLRYLVLQLYLVIKASIFVPTLVGSFEFRYQLCGLHASIFREGPGNDLQGFGKFVDGILFKACTSLTENRKNS